jgi:hypothetical protein
VCGDAGLDVDDGDRVRDGVVDLACDPEPFLVDRARASRSRVRSASSARSSASAAMTLLERTLSPRAALITEAPIRKNTQPMAAGGWMSAAAISQPAARTAIPTPAATSERRPSPRAVSV